MRKMRLLTIFDLLIISLGRIMGARGDDHGKYRMGWIKLYSVSYNEWHRINQVSWVSLFDVADSSFSMHPFFNEMSSLQYSSNMQ